MLVPCIVEIFKNIYFTEGKSAEGQNCAPLQRNAKHDHNKTGIPFHSKTCTGAFCKKSYSRSN